MQISVQSSSKKKLSKRETLILPVFDDLGFDRTFLNRTQEALVSESMKEKEFLGGEGEIFTLPEYGTSERLILLGLGTKERFSLDRWKRALGKAVRFLQERRLVGFSISLPQDIEKGLGRGDALRLSTVILFSASYQFCEYFSDKSRRVAPLEVVTFVVVGKRNTREDKKEVKEGIAIGGAIDTTRELGNLPPAEMTPKCLTKASRKMVKKYPKLKMKVFGRKELVKEKMGGLLGVSAGSNAEPQFIILEWMNAPKIKDIRVFAGKGITFDSGGLSIKPASKMDEMKFDMMGGASVIGAMEAIAKLDLKVNIVALVPATENLSGSKAYRPGDILRAKNGKTMEIINTDAEGRVVLADALSYAQKYKPSFVIDLATLTGACVVALGGNYAGLFTRSKKIEEQIKRVAKKSGEKVWSLPLDDDFSESVKSDIADVRNIGKGNSDGGASSAAAFLENFIDYPWVHLDIAGVAWGPDMPHIRSGATGYGVSLLVELAQSWEKEIQ